MPIKINELDHIVLNVSDIHRSLDFYTRVLGLSGERVEEFKAGTVGYVNPEKYDQWPVELWGPVGYVREGLNRQDAVVRKLASELEVPLLDQKQLMGDHIELFGDICHLNEAGTEQFVDHIADFLLQNGFERPYGR